MLSCLTKKICSPLLTLSLLLTLLAPQTGVAQDNGKENEIMKKSVQDMATVASLGVAGAVLGLSTLSFMDEPEDHLKNIVVGGALGIIIGVGVVAYNQANQTKQFYRENVYEPADFSTADRVSWHESSTQSLQDDRFAAKTTDEAPALTYHISF